MTLGERLKSLRREIGLSQEAIGAQGFVSSPGWIKIENDQRQASDSLLERVVKWLVEEKYLRPGAGNALKTELLALKYVASRSAFVRTLARNFAQTLPGGHALVADSAQDKRVRGRPPKSAYLPEALLAETPGLYKTSRPKVEDSKLVPKARKAKS